jgi:signal transduction histidine kinase/ActR/RegA family two-component response regulator
MMHAPASRPVSQGLRVNFALLLMGGGLLALILLAAGALAARQTLAQTEVRRSLDIVEALNGVLAELLDAETGQRGYIIAQDDAYLQPFERSAPQVRAELQHLHDVTKDIRGYGNDLAALSDAVEHKLAELQHTIDLVRAGQAEDAIARVRDDRGKAFMDRARGIICRLLHDESERLLRSRAAAVAADRALQFGIGGSVLILAGVAFVGFRAARRQFAELAQAHHATAEANEKLRLEAEERERIGAQLRQAQKMEAIGQLTGGLAHDFNNMLSVILGNLSLLKLRLERRGETNLTQLVHNAMDGGKRAAALTDRLLAFARQQPLAPQPIDANKFVAGMADLLGRTLGEDVKLETVLAGGLWSTNIDASQFENAILNLAVNARDAMRGGGKLTIETANAHLDDSYAAGHPEVKAGQYVLLAVTDTGQGMSPDILAKAFDPFFTTKSGKGTGLGLSQVYGFVKQSGGHIKLYSEPGVGMTVKLYLPRFTGTADGTRTTATTESPMPRARPEETVLVVEDEESVRLSSIEAVAELGYRVYAAESAASALALLDDHPDIGLLFTDIVMPEVNGRALADEATRRRPRLRVLFTTGFTRNAIIHNGTLDAGVNLLAKPYTLEALAQKLRRVFDDLPQRA